MRPTKWETLGRSGTFVPCAKRNSQAATKNSTAVTRVPHVKRAMLARQAAKTSKMAAPVTPSLAKQNKHKQQQKMGLTVCTMNESVCIHIVYYFYMCFPYPLY